MRYEARMAQAEALARPRRGLVFLHARQIVATPGVPCREWPPERCEVTKVARDIVYFRNSTGMLCSVALEKFPESVREVVDTSGTFQ